MLLSSLFGSTPSAGCALTGVHRLRHSLAAVLFVLPLLLGLAVPNEAYAQSCNVSNARTQATGAYNHHRNNGNGNAPTATAAYRALIALGGTLPAWTGTNLSGISTPTTPISEAELRTFLTGQGDTWTGWNPVYTALNCLEAALPAVTIAGGAAVTEGAGARFTVSVSPAQGSALTVNLNVTDAAGSDFVASGNEGMRTVTIPANQTSAVHTVPTVNDQADEPNGQVTVTVAGGSGYKPGATATATVTVNDNDEPSAADRVQMNYATRSVAEFGSSLRATVQIGDGGKLAGHHRTIKYKLSGTAKRGDGKDYTIDFGSNHSCTSSNDCTVRLPANTYSVPIIIKPNNDGIDEGDETIIITLQNGAGYTLNAKRKATVTILDDDTRGLTFHRRWADVKEGASGTLTVRLSSQPTAAVTVKITSNNPDVTVSPTSLTFNPSGNTNLWSRARTVTVSAAEDRDAVDDEATLTYTTSGGDYGGANALSIGRSVSVDDDETSTIRPGPQLPRITLTGGAAVTEGSPAIFTVNADRAPTASLTVNVEVIEPDGQNFVAASQEGVRTVTLNAGATSATFTVPTVNDNTDENDGAVQVLVNDGTGYVAGSGDSVTVRDNDNPIPAAYFGSGSSSAAENAGTQNVAVNLTRPAPSGGLTLGYNVTGTATAGSGNDFTIRNSGTLSIAAGATSASIPVAINDDSTNENDETVVLTLTGGTGYRLGSPQAHTLTITDNDNPFPAASFAAGSSSAAENAGTHNVRVNLSSAAPSGGLTLAYNVTGSATAGGGNDFTIRNSGTLSIAAGATSASIPVAINDDSTQESAETVILTLTGGTGYRLGSPRVHTLTITDNDTPQPGTPALRLSGNTLSVSEGGTGSYTVRLATAPTGTVIVNIASDNGDVTVSPSSLTFNPSGSNLWNSPRTVTVSAAQDEDSADGSATLTHTASGGGYGGVAAASATVTVNDDDGTNPGPGPSADSNPGPEPEPGLEAGRGWLVRIGRTMAGQGLDGIARRLRAPRTPGMEGRLGGQAIAFNPWAATGAAGRAPVSTGGASRPGSPADRAGAQGPADIARHLDGGQDGRFGGIGTGSFGFGAAETQTMTGRELLLGSSFSLTGGKNADGGTMALWGRAAHGTFDGEEDALGLDGEVTTGILGADYARGKWLAGLALTHSTGEGGYRGIASGGDAVIAGKAKSSLTAALPYAALRVSKQLKLWGAAGYGTGEVTLTPEDGDPMSADTDWMMAAAGFRDELLAPPAEGSGPSFTVTSDAMWANTTSEKTAGLAASDADVTRLRFGLEGGWRIAMADDGHLTPTLELGGRHDGGDAETGFGVELGGGIAWADPDIGLLVDVSGRTLIAHEDGDLKDRGLSASVAFDPDPASERGPSLSLLQEFGGPAEGGLDALFANDPLEDRTGSEAESRWSAEAAYGFPAFGGRFTGSPHAGFGLATGRRDYSLGWRWTPAANGPDLPFGLKAVRRESDTKAPEHTVGLEATVRW